MQILVIGKPKIGKTTFCKKLAEKLDVIHIEIEKSLEALMKRVKEYEESPEQDEEGNNKLVEDVITPAEAAILIDLKEG